MNVKYYELLLAGKIEEAESLRISENPKTLHKYISLKGNDEDEAKYTSLSNNCMWFSSVDSFNDPYEHKGMILNKEYLIKAGIHKKVIDIYNGLFDTDDLEVACLTASGHDNLPMWAYYANNSQGFCVEYDVINKSAIHEVIYEPKRVKVGKLLIEMLKNATVAIRGDASAKVYADSLAKIMMSSMYIKDSSWQHEKEYRIVAPIHEHAGENIPINQIGLRVNKIIAGVHCKPEDVRRLATISMEMVGVDLYRAVLSDDSFGIVLKKYNI